ncbi:MAG: hypothetical protein ACPKOI_04770 [Pleomorphochaeta sp.]
MNFNFGEIIRYVLSNPLFYIWLIFLQILFCTRKNKYVGIILPSIFILYSVIVGLYFLALQNISEIGEVSNTLILEVFIFSFVPGIVLLGIFLIFQAFKKKAEKFN